MRFCTYCGETFTRDEHLERHILTHTKIKLFRCSHCYMEFARRDLLQRHYAVHGKDHNNQEVLPPNNGMILKSAGRTPKACINCAKTKTKCDKNFPCSRCASRNLTCTMRPTSRRAKQAANRTGSQQKGAECHETASAHGDELQNDPNLNSPEGGQRSPKQKTQDYAPSKHNTTEQELSPEVSSEEAFVSSLMSPVLEPNGILDQSRMASYDEFMPATTANGGSNPSGSPPFLMDWSQLQMSNFPAHMMIPGDVGMDISGASAIGADAMLNVIPDFSQPMLTPLHTPRIEQSSGPDFDMSCSTNSVQSMFFPTGILTSTRHPSVSGSYDSGVADLNAAAAQDGWNLFRCAPPLPPHLVPKTARANLERLETSLKNHEAWSNWQPPWDTGDFAVNDQLTVLPLRESTRDKLLAITQAFLHKALETHRDGSHTPAPEISSMPYHISSNFVLLPPARVLECFLNSYANSFEPFFPLSSQGVLDANELLSNYSDIASHLLVLLMIAQGTMVMPTVDARSITNGLTEACRISLFDAIEKDISLASDLSILRAALLFIVQAAWSGDKWQMDIAIGQRGMYLAMLRHSGKLSDSMMESQSISPKSRDGISNLWADWVSQESQSRLVHSWLIVDQDLSFFHDSAPQLNVSEFNIPMPDVDRLWYTKSAQEWFAVAAETDDNLVSTGKKTRPVSIRDLFRQFLDENLAQQQSLTLTPLQLRLLLHPIQSLVCGYTQVLSYSSDLVRIRNGSRAVTALEEMQILLQRWHDHAECYLRQNLLCVTMQATLIMFHLISLNAVTNFPEIEKLARREGFDGSYEQLLWLHKRCITDVQGAIVHAGQILRLIRSMPRSVRPPWWPGAVYRVALVLWTDALRHNDSVENSNVNSNESPQSAVSGNNDGIFQHRGHSRSHSSMSVNMSINIPMDALSANHQLIHAYLTKREGKPVLTRRDGSHLSLDHAFTVLSHCVDVLDEGVPTQFSDGIRSKLERLARG